MRNATWDLNDRPRRFDPLVALSCLVALLVYLPHGFNGELTRDLGVYSYGGQQVAEGVPPYVAILNRAGPLAHLIPGIGVYVARHIGVDDVLGMRVLFMLIAVACVGTTYLLGRDAFRSRRAGLAAAAAMLCFKGFIIYATYGPREKTPMVLFLLCALLAMVHQRWATTGCFIALATLTWQPVFFAAIAGVVVAVLLGVPQHRVRALLRLAVGGLVPLLVTVVAYAAVGDLKVFVDDFLLVNARYTHQASLLGQPGKIVTEMWAVYGWTLGVFVVGSLVQLRLAVRAFRAPGRREPLAAAQIGVGVLFLVGVVWSLVAFNGWPDCFFMFPGAAVGIGGLVTVIARRLDARATLVATAAWVLVVTGLSLVYTLTTRADSLVEQRLDVATVLKLVPSDSRILSLEAPQALVLAHERNLSRFQLFGNGALGYLDDVWPGGRQGYARWVAAKKPNVIAVGTQSGMPFWMAPTVKAAYTKVGASPSWTWYIRDDLGTTTIRAVKAALRDPS